MKRNKRKFIELVYNLMIGSLDLKNHPVKEKKYVKNEYKEGKYCDKKYRKVFNANRRICERLGIEDGEDDDVECIISNLLDIQQHMCMKMYKYGWKFARREGKK